MQQLSPSIPANLLNAPFAVIGRTLALPDGIPNLEPSDYRIGDRAPVVLAGEGGPRLAMTPWAWKGPTGKPVFNFWSESRSFVGSTRCLIPLTASMNSPSQGNIEPDQCCGSQ